MYLALTGLKEASKDPFHNIVGTPLTLPSSPSCPEEEWSACGGIFLPDVPSHTQAADA